MEKWPGSIVVGLSFMVKASIKATTRYTSAILCEKYNIVLFFTDMMIQNFTETKKLD